MLSLLASDFYRSSPWLVAPLVALGIFMTVFSLLTVRALRAKKSELEKLARLPLEANDD